MSTKRRPLRGLKLEKALDTELESMLQEGLTLAPITISSVAKRLGLGSRNTLSTLERKSRIQAAALRQRTLLGNDQDRKTRDSLAQLDRLKGDKVRLLKDLNSLRVQLVQVAINAHKLGYNPEKLLQALREQKQITDPAEEVWERYLRKIGLLEKLDSNVRRFVV